MLGCRMVNLLIQDNHKRTSHSSSSSSVMGFLGETPLRRVVKVNFDATLPSCNVFMVSLSSKRSNPKTCRQRLSRVTGQITLIMTVRRARTLCAFVDILPLEYGYHVQTIYRPAEHKFWASFRTTCFFQFRCVKVSQTVYWGLCCLVCRT